MLFSAELREMIIENYLHGEVDNNTISKAIHHDKFGKQCCVGDWPKELVIYHKHEEDELTPKTFPKWHSRPTHKTTKRCEYRSKLKKSHWV
jgi:hypothetical protein